MRSGDEKLVQARLESLRAISPATDEAWSATVQRASGPIGIPMPAPSGRSHRGRWLAAAAVAAVAGGAAVVMASGGSSPEPLRTGASTTTTATSVVPEGLLKGTVTVSEAVGDVPRICVSDDWVGGSACSGPEISGWSWNRAGGSTTGADGERTGRYEVTGRLQGDVFTLETAAIATGGTELDATSPAPCTAQVTDAERTRQSDFDAMLTAAKALPDYAGEWYSRDDGAPAMPFDPASGTETIAVAADPESVRPQLEALWGGKLCIVEAERSLAELQAVLDRVEPFAVDHGLEIVSVVVDQEANTVQATVVVSGPQAQQDADAAFGPGAVTVAGLLSPM